MKPLLPWPRAGLALVSGLPDAASRRRTTESADSLRNRRRRARVILRTLVLGCGLCSLSADVVKDKTAVPAGLDVEFIDAAAPEAARAKQLGEGAITWLGAKMLNELAVAMRQGGPEEAVEVCHLKSVSTADHVLPGMPFITAFKCTSLCVFNPANAPDAAEQLVLDRIQHDIDAGQVPPKAIIQRITDPESGVEWRVYRPLATLPACVACHGASERQSSGLQALLRARFPDAEATDYRVGEWRGLIRVSVALE